MAKQRAAEEREQELAAQRAQREAERQALRRLEKSFAVRVEGTATIHKPEKVTATWFSQKTVLQETVFGPLDSCVSGQETSC